jgi:tetratricopeptide (TPR) repeat protein
MKPGRALTALGCVLIIVFVFAEWAFSGNHVSGSDAVNEAIQYERYGFKSLAMKLYARIVSSEPGNFEAHRGYQRMMSEMGRKKEAINEYERKVLREPRNAQLHALLAILYEDYPAKAITLATKAIALDPSLILGEVVLGLSLANVGRVDEALKVLREVLRREPTNARAAVVYGFVLAEAGRMAEAIKATEAAAGDVVMGPYARSFLGRYYLKVGRSDEGLAELEKAIVLHPFLALPRVVLAEYHNSRNEYRKAIEEYRMAIARHHGEAAFYNNLAWLLATTGSGLADLNEAVGLAEHAVELSERKTPEHLDTLAEAYYRVGLKRRAVAVIQEAIGLKPKDEKYYKQQLEKFQKQ